MVVIQFGLSPVDHDGDRQSEDENPDKSAQPSDQLGREFLESSSSAEVVANSAEINFFPPRVCI